MVKKKSLKFTSNRNKTLEKTKKLKNKKQKYLFSGVKPLPFSANNPESEPAKKEAELWRLHHSKELDEGLILPSKNNEGYEEPLSVPPYFPDES